MRRGEKLRRDYWPFVHKRASETGKSIAEVRREFKGSTLPYKEASHLFGDEYYYHIRPKRGSGGQTPVIVRSDEILTDSEARQRAAVFYNARKSDYGETDGRYWNEDELVVTGSTRAAPFFDEEDEEEEGEY